MLIQKLRLQKGWSQQQLADLSGLSVRTIQRLEQGLPGSVESLKSLASVFQIDFSELKEPDMPNSTAEATPSPAAVNDHHAREIEEMLAFQHVRRLRRFYLSLGSYAVIIPFLAVINLMTAPHHFWFIWPALGWGLGLALQGVKVFTHLRLFGPEWEKRQVEKRLGRAL